MFQEFNDPGNKPTWIEKSKSDFEIFFRYIKSHGYFYRGLINIFDDEGNLIFAWDKELKYWDENWQPK